MRKDDEGVALASSAHPFLESIHASEFGMAYDGGSSVAHLVTILFITASRDDFHKHTAYSSRCSRFPTRPIRHWGECRLRKHLTIIYISCATRKQWLLQRYTYMISNDYVTRLVNDSTTIMINADRAKIVTQSRSASNPFVESCSDSYPRVPP